MIENRAGPAGGNQGAEYRMLYLSLNDGIVTPPVTGALGVIGLAAGPAKEVTYVRIDAVD